MPRITRETLYEQVWSKPLRDVAKRYGITSTELTKICTRLHIPRPSQGHWSRILHEHEVIRTPLPSLAAGAPADVVLTEHAATGSDEPVSAPAKLAIVVNAKFTNGHPAIRQLAGLIRNKVPDHEMKAVFHPGQATLRVTSSQQDRALRILDALCRWLDSNGYLVSLIGLPKDKHSYALLVQSGTKRFRISLMERQEQLDHVRTSKEKDDEARFGLPFGHKFDYKPSGQLTLHFLDESNSYRSYGRWKDTATKLETKLGDAALRVPTIFDEIDAESRRREEKDRLWQVAAEERAREARRSMHDGVLREDLGRMIDRWEQARRIRAFVDAAEPAILAGPNGDTAARTAWLAWARAYADSMDPVCAAGGIAKALSPS